MKKALHSLSFRLAVLVGLASAAGLLMHFFLSMSHHEEALVQLKREEANLLSDTIKHSLSHAMEQGKAGRDAIHKVIAEVGRREEIERVRIFNAVGHIQYSTDPSEMGTTVDKEAENCKQCHSEGEPLRHLAGADRSRFFYTPSGAGSPEYRVLGVINPIYNEPEDNCSACHGEQTVLGVLDVVVSLRRLDEEIADHRESLAVMSAVALLAISGVVWLVTRLVVHRPVAALLDGTRKVGLLDLDYRIPAERRDDLGDLARAFNAMTARLNDAREEIRDFTELLEERVEEKTAALESAQRRALRSEKLAAIGQMAAGVAHEINNPLTGVITFAHLIRRNMPEDSQDREDLDTIIGEAQRCSKIARDLLDFARPGELQRGETAIESLLERTLAVVEHQALFHNIEIVREFAPELPLLSVDKDRIQQVFLNLIMNAAEAMEGSGTLTLKTAAVPSEAAVRVEVADTGPGIPDAILPRIFDPFFSTKEVGAGTGLGLSVSFRMVEDHGGRIRVESVVGQGTRFFVTLPVAGGEERP